jgi:hypothetical protein
VTTPLLLYALEMHFGIDDIMTTAESCLTDGPHDRKCDAVFLDRETATAVIAQGYFATTKRPAALSSKAADLNTAVSWVFGGAPEAMHESLRAAAQDLEAAIRAGEIERVELWYCHNLPESKNVQEELTRAAGTAHGLLRLHFAESDVSVGALEVGINRLSEWYAAIQTPVLVSDTIDVRIDGFFEEVGTDWTSVCCSVPARWLKELHDKYDTLLFSANVRGYMPSRKTARNINHNIEQTAKKRPGHFWAFNNGVTALVHDYKTPEAADRRGLLELQGIAIVNGAQTTGALSRANADRLEDASVLARFVKCENNDTIDDVIRYNNSQNPIKPSDFRSTDRHQDRLRDQFQAIPGAVYFGARRGGQQDRARRPSNLVPSDTAAQALAAFHGDPGLAYHNLRGIWERDEVYSKYFSDFTTATHVVFTYSLLSAIQRAKSELAARESSGDLAEDEIETLAFFRQRGSQFLLQASIGACMEIILGTAVPNKFSLSFGSAISPARGRDLWKPIVEAVTPFAHCLRAEDLRGSLRNQVRVDDAINAFRSIVRSTARSNKDVFGEFAAGVEINQQLASSAP